MKPINDLKINEAALLELKNMMGEAAKTLIETLCADLNYLHAELCTPQTSPEGKKRAAHTLKSLARMAGADSLADDAALFEQACLDWPEYQREKEALSLSQKIEILRKYVETQ